MIQAKAVAYFDFSPRAEQAYQKAINLQLDEAKILVTQLKSTAPHNLIAYHIENYIDFFHLYIQEDHQAYNTLKRNKNSRLEKVQKGDKNSPYYLYVQADIRMQWAFLKWKFGENVGALQEINKAYKLLLENQKKFPDFMPNLKDLGLLHAMVGSIPDNLKWGVKLVSSLDGTIAQGRKEIEEVLRYARTNEFIFEEETIIIYAFLLFSFESDHEEAWETLTNNNLQPTSNPLHCFVMANIALYTGKNDEALTLLEHRPKSRQYLSFPLLDYLHGIAKIRKLDTSAKEHFRTYLQEFKGKSHIKAAYQKIAWAELLQYDFTGYSDNMQLSLQQGSLVAEEDKNAQKEAEMEVIPDITLLKARLLFDGGYYSKALSILQVRGIDAYLSAKNKLECSYRIGRILHGLKRWEDAKVHYQKTIDNGQYESYAYACNAALQMGIIYEAQRDYKRAKEYFKLCLSMKPDDYRNSLHQKAKSGLNRIDN